MLTICRINGVSQFTFALIVDAATRNEVEELHLLIALNVDVNNTENYLRKSLLPMRLICDVVCFLTKGCNSLRAAVGASALKAVKVILATPRI